MMSPFSVIGRFKMFSVDWKCRVHIRNALREIDEEIAETIFSVLDDLSFDNYGEIVRTLEQSGMSYKHIKEAIKIVYRIHSAKAADDDREYMFPASFSESKALSHYISEGYENINDYLLGFEAGHPEVDELIDEIDAVLDRTEKLDMTLYRSMQLDAGDFHGIIGEGEFTFKNFVSTSYNAGMLLGGWHGNCTSFFCENQYNDKKKLQNTINTAWVIETKGNTKGLRVGGYSWNPEENEVLLPRGLSVKINKVVESFGNEDHRQFTIFCEVI